MHHEFDIGLVTEIDGAEAFWWGYKRQSVRLEPEKSGHWSNTNSVLFPQYPLAPSITVVGFRLFNNDELWVDVALTRALCLCEGITPALGTNALLADDLLIEMLVGPKKPTAGKPLPTNCRKCNFYNEYIGVEHLRKR